jgi:hypothetical protein
MNTNPIVLSRLKYLEEMQLTGEQLASFDKALDVAKPFMIEIIRLGQEMQKKIQEEVPNYDGDWDETGLIYDPNYEPVNLEFWQNK